MGGDGLPGDGRAPALTTTNGSPAHRPAYRSSTRPAFSANWGSRGKSQLRYRQGVRASRSSRRQMVLTLTGGASGCADQSRQIGRAQAAQRFTMLCRQFTSQGCDRGGVQGGNGRLASTAGCVRQPHAVSGPAAASVADPVGMLAQVTAGHHIVEGRLGVQQQRQLGPIDLRLGRAVSSRSSWWPASR